MLNMGWNCVKLGPRFRRVGLSRIAWLLTHSSISSISSITPSPYSILIYARLITQLLPAPPLQSLIHCDVRRSYSAVQLTCSRTHQLVLSRMVHCTGLGRRFYTSYFILFFKFLRFLAPIFHCVPPSCGP